MNTIARLTDEYKNKKIPDFNSGDTVSVEVTVREGNKTRLQKYEGIVISRHGKKGMDASFTVRKISNGVGVASGYFLFTLQFYLRSRLKDEEKLEGQN